MTKAEYFAFVKDRILDAMEESMPRTEFWKAVDAAYKKRHPKPQVRRKGPGKKLPKRKNRKRIR